MVAAVAATFLFCCWLVIHGWNQYRVAAQHPTFAHPAGVLADVRPAVFRDRPRPVYPFSIIRGGAYSGEELVHALESDPVAKSHYDMFQRAQLRSVRSTFVKPVYLSYRKGNLIFWTSHPVSLHDGETLLTDGNLYARARCGNRISLVPLAPVAKVEPVPDVLDTPEPMEAILEPLLEAAVELDPTVPPVIDPEDFASSVTGAVKSDPPPEPWIAEIILQLLPVVGIADTVSPAAAGLVSTQFATGPYPGPVGLVQPPPLKFAPTTNDLQPVPEPSESVLTIVAGSVLVLWSMRLCGADTYGGGGKTELRTTDELNPPAIVIVMGPPNSPLSPLI
ncbi:MAG TPA: hypothetical protein VGZ73_27015 [Bryobacteraceae bacterium]|nr:hypothetical protein [Bryobacteraceae bacterium]